MKHSTFKEVVTKLIEYRNKENEYLDSIPSDIQSLIFDNEYTNSKEYEIELLISAWCDNKNIEEDVYWIIYEWRPGFTVKINSKDYTIKSIDEFFVYMQIEYLWDEE